MCICRLGTRNRGLTQLGRSTQIACRRTGQPKGIWLTGCFWRARSALRRSLVLECISGILAWPDGSLVVAQSIDGQACVEHAVALQTTSSTVGMTERAKASGIYQNLVSERPPCMEDYLAGTLKGSNG